ncbi:MAG TPA: SET domain-containing protein [Xanthomonadales bacterium]|nr:SET domain-containing protein [Xanthomonadales bacterium]
MILPLYRIDASPIAGAGKGLFLAEPVARGRIIVAPDAIPRTYHWREIEAAPDRDALLPSAVRWFEDQFTVTPDWPDECYVNHSFAPTGLWHLGFIFAAADLAPGTEITIDYRHLLGEGQEESFPDSRTGERIVGFAWDESLRRSTEALRALLAG